jgi:hypothetical protein
MANTTKLTEKSTVRVINNTRGSLSFRDNNDKRHLFPKPQSFKDLELTIIKNLYNDYPIFVEQGLIVFSDKRVYDFLEIPEDIISGIILLDEIKAFLEKDAKELEEQLKNLPQAVKENVAMVAKELEIDSKKKTKAIKNATGFNVEKMEE